MKSTEVSTYNGDALANPFTVFRQRNSTMPPTPWRGPTLKLDHQTGDWSLLHGEESSLVDPELPFKTNPFEMIEAWTKFVDGKPVENHVYRTASFEFAPERTELGDTDEYRWPMSYGKRKDPWQRAIYLPGQLDGELVCFRATSQSALSEVAEFIGMFGADDRQGMVPVVGLDSRSFVSGHGSTIYVPVLRLLSWEFWDDAPLKMPTQKVSAITVKAPLLEAPTPAKGPLASSLDDDIPF